MSDQVNFNIISQAVTSVVSIIGNSLVLVIITRPKLFEISMFRYYIAATVIDTINVLATPLYVFPEYTGFNTNQLSCKLINFITNVFYIMSPWTVVLACLDRYLSVKYPNRFEFTKDLRCQILALIIVYCVITLINTPFYIFSVLGDNQTFCYIAADFNIQYSMDIFNAFQATFVPFFIMMLTSLLTTRQLIINKKKFNKREFRNEMKFVKIMLAMNFFFLATNLPYSIVNVVYYTIGISDFTDYFSYDISLFLNNIYYSCDFFVFFLSNRLFRQCFFKLIHSCKRNNRVTPMVTSVIF
jgi:hypothetical protein